MAMPENGWYFVGAEGLQQGPNPRSSLLAMQLSGRITADTLVWVVGMSEWQPFASVFKELLPPPIPSSAVPPSLPTSTPPVDASKSESDASLTMDNNSPLNIQPQTGFFGKLTRGDFGLAKTYWLFGVLVGLVVNIISVGIGSSVAFTLLVVAYTAYETPVLIGIWRASDKYQGPSVWAVLAKIAVVLGVLFLLFGLLAALASLPNRRGY